MSVNMRICFAFFHNDVRRKESARSLSLPLLKYVKYELFTTGQSVDGGGGKNGHRSFIKYTAPSEMFRSSKWYYFGNMLLLRI